jgi:hypothetical protein
MIDSSLFGLASGLILMFALLALFCSAVCELLANLLQMRAKYLLRGLRTLLDEAVDGQASTGGGKTARLGKLHKIVITSTETAVMSFNSLASAANVKFGDLEVKELQDAQKKVRELKGGLTAAVYGNPLVQSLRTRRITLGWTLVRNPPYLSAGLFARVLVDTLVPDASGQATVTQIATTLASLPDGMPAKKSLLALVKRAGSDLDGFETLVGQWYDEHMARVSGWYKRWSRVVLGLVGLLIAVAANVDTLQIARNLYVDQPVRGAVIAQVSAGRLCGDVTDPLKRATCVSQEIASLKASGLPVGWPLPGYSWPALALKLLGWILTAFAVSFGAPFWFGALSRLAPLRNTGPKPPPVDGSNSSSPPQ